MAGEKVEGSREAIRNLVDAERLDAFLFGALRISLQRVRGPLADAQRQHCFYSARKAAFGVMAAPPPKDTAVFLHCDLMPVNMLWSRGKITGRSSFGRSMSRSPG